MLSEEVLSKIDKLKPGDLVTVVWHDACAFSRIEQLTPEVYATIKKTVGYFTGLMAEPKTGYKYLILTYEETDGKPTDGTSIPLGCIQDIMVKEKRRWKSPLKDLKVSSGPVKILEVTQKVGIHA